MVQIFIIRGFIEGIDCGLEFVARGGRKRFVWCSRKQIDDFERLLIQRGWEVKPSLSRSGIFNARLIEVRMITDIPFRGEPTYNGNVDADDYGLEAVA